MRVLAIVLAGGRGYRFWPKSSDACPKQFLDLFGQGSLLQMTVDRLGSLLGPEDIYVVTGAAHEALVREQLPGLPPANVITEPMGRDTAAAVGYALTVIGEKDPSSVAVVLPSDHRVSDRESWSLTVAGACRAARIGWPVLIGIPPTRPETAYGYILPAGEAPQVAPFLPGESLASFYRVERFVEKPDRETAERLVAGGRALWNSGMFVWRVDTVLRLLRRHLPATYAALEAIRRMREGATPPGSPAWRERVAPLFAGLKPVSIDYGIIEKCADALVTRGEFGWDDVGGWEAVARFSPADERGNVTRGDVTLKDAAGCIVDWDQGPALVVGMKDTVVAGTSGGLLVCPRSRLDEVKGLLAARAGPAWGGKA